MKSSLWTSDFHRTVIEQKNQKKGESRSDTRHARDMPIPSPCSQGCGIVLSMLGKQYIARVKDTISAFDPEGVNRYFIFGSAARKERFGDVDIGVLGNAKAQKDLSDLRENFEESTFPYEVDVVDFDEARESFTTYVKKNEPVIWIQ